LKRNFTVNAGQILKMCMQISQLDLNNIEVLEGQLVGIDASYFHQVLSILKEDNKTEIDYAYLIEVIDRIF
jgi:hypothetical protein